MSDNMNLNLADVTWSNLAPATFTHFVVYAETEKRDWRWLWLRKRRRSEVVFAGEWDEKLA